MNPGWNALWLLGEMLGIVALGYVAVERLVSLVLDRIDRALARNDRQWERLVAAQSGLAQEMVTTAAFGGVPAEAVVAREEDAQERMEREISEQTVTNGIAALREAYAEKGITLSDEELREEVMLLASGFTPKLPGD